MVRFLCIILLLISHVTLADEPLYLCEPNEKLIFGCKIKNKLISICSSKHLSKTTGYAQYRFGKTDKIEFLYPNAKIPPASVFYLSSTACSGGGANIIRFSNSGHEYLIFDSMVRTNFVPGEPNDPEFKAGIITRHNGKITSTRLCSDNDASIRAAAFEVFEREEFEYDIIP